MKGKTWAYAQQGLLAIASASRFQRDPRYRAWAKTMFDRGLDLYDRMGGDGRLAASNLSGVAARTMAHSDDLLFAPRTSAAPTRRAAPPRSAVRRRARRAGRGVVRR